MIFPGVVFRPVIAVCLLVAAMGWNDACAQAPAPRNWVDSQGRTLSAAFVRTDGASVVLRRAPDNREFTISLPSLSAQDQAWVRSQAASAPVAATAGWDASLDTFRTELATAIWGVYQRNAIGKTTPEEKAAWEKLRSRFEKKSVRWPVQYTDCEAKNEFELKVGASSVYLPGKASEGTVRFTDMTASPAKPANGGPLFDHPIVVRAVPTTAGKQRWTARKPGPAVLSGSIDKVEVILPVFAKDPGLATVLVTVTNASPAN